MHSQAHTAFAAAVSHSLASDLHVQTDQISHLTVSLLPASALTSIGRRLMMGDPASPVTLTGLLNATVVLHPPYGSLPYSKVLDMISGYDLKAPVSGARVQPVVVRGVLRVVAVSVAGNNMCELGEMPTPMSRGKIPALSFAYSLSDDNPYLSKNTVVQYHLGVIRTS